MLCTNAKDNIVVKPKSNVFLTTVNQINSVNETYPNGIWVVTLCYINNVTSGTMSAIISDFDEASQTEIPIACGCAFIPKPSSITKECMLINAAPVDSYPYYTVQAGHTLRLQLTYESDDESSLWLGSDSSNSF